MKKYWLIETIGGQLTHEYDAPENTTVQNTVAGEISRREILEDEYQKIIDSQNTES